jgi:hypothetical protein
MTIREAADVPGWKREAAACREGGGAKMEVVEAPFASPRPKYHPTRRISYPD